MYIWKCRFGWMYVCKYINYLGERWQSCGYSEGQRTVCCLWWIARKRGEPGKCSDNLKWAFSQFGRWKWKDAESARYPICSRLCYSRLFAPSSSNYSRSLGRSLYFIIDSLTIISTTVNSVIVSGLLMLILIILTNFSCYNSSYNSSYNSDFNSSSNYYTIITIYYHLLYFAIKNSIENSIHYILTIYFIIIIYSNLFIIHLYFIIFITIIKLFFVNSGVIFFNHSYLFLFYILYS